MDVGTTYVTEIWKSVTKTMANWCENCITSISIFLDLEFSLQDHRYSVCLHPSLFSWNLFHINPFYLLVLRISPETETPSGPWDWSVHNVMYSPLPAAETETGLCGMQASGRGTATVRKTLLFVHIQEVTVFWWAHSDATQRHISSPSLMMLMSSWRLETMVVGWHFLQVSVHFVLVPGLSESFSLCSKVKPYDYSIPLFLSVSKWMIY